ncbi:hypothetical protein [Elizabethkingia sp. JS20170427COW]|uniref:hypothetical protein n=1 Tax=Elizabethkingia sp. JS20170427COW TaxID=2583851 RepID=UPI00143CD289|nr:hypothetical protein [Elizabethkingia sp. JS20170427COW]
MEELKNKNTEPSKFMKWFKRVGWAGLIFFTVKGLVWLAIFYFGADALQSCF